MLSLKFLRTQREELFAFGPHVKNALLDQRGATPFIGNLPFDGWMEPPRSERLTGVRLDCVTHHLNIPEINGDSYRLAQNRARKASPPNHSATGFCSGYAREMAA